MTARSALWGLVGLATGLRLALAAGLGPGNDEAYYFLFTVHRDWSYFDHPPMLAVVASTGLALVGHRPSAFALRLGIIALSVGSTLLMARLTARLFGAWAGVLAAFVLNATGYYGLAAGTFALPDGPFLFFWLLTLDRLLVALGVPGETGTAVTSPFVSWLWVGLAWGGALLSKYHAVFLPIGTLCYLGLEPSARRWLRRPGPYIALTVGVGAFAPVIGWNAAHGWASFAFQGGRALGGWSLRPGALAGAVLGPALYLFPWIWVFLVATLLRSVRRLAGGATAAERFLLGQAIPPVTMFLAVACRREVLPHWSLVGLLPVIPLLGRDWAADWGKDPARIRRRLTVFVALPVALAGLVVWQARTGRLPIPNDPTLDLHGWDQVARALERRGLVARTGPFLFTSKWYDSGQLALATRGAVPVLCYSAGDARGFAHWSRPQDWVGRDGLLVVVDPCSTEPAAFDRWFARIEPAGEVLIRRGGATAKRVRLYRCARQTQPFPFAGAARREAGDGRPR